MTLSLKHVQTLYRDVQWSHTHTRVDDIGLPFTRNGYFPTYCKTSILSLNLCRHCEITSLLHKDSSWKPSVLGKAA